LSNFRIEENQNSRVYFDTSQPIFGKSVAGFKISDKNIIGLKLIAGSTTGHYFSVSKDFSFWDNNSIRYEGGSDIENENSIVIDEFTLMYIENNIPEPIESGKTYYVSVNGDNKNDGKSISKPWKTITYAALKAQAGDLVYIKAGDYGAESASVKNNGTAKSPIKFIGYKNQPGDNPTLNRSQNTKFSSLEMPYIHSTSKSGSGFAAIDKEYIIIRNLQVEGYKHTVDIAKSSYTIVDNVYAKGGKTNINNFPHYKSIQNRVINSYVANGSHNGVYMTGARHLIENVYATSKGKPNMDYYIVIVGGNVGIGEHIIRNCEIVRDLNDTHPGHGISLKAQGRDIGYSLVEKSKITNVGMSLEARHSGSRNNVYKDLFITSEGSRYGKGIQITSAMNSIFERIHVENKTYGIKFLGSTEDPEAKDAGNGNLIRNCIFTNNSINIQVIKDLDGQNRVPRNNLIANCTFNNAGSMFLFEANEKGQNNVIINSIVNEVENEFYKKSKVDRFNFSYSNFYSSNKSNWSSKLQSGEGNISKNPAFENLGNDNFRLKSSSPLIDKGKRIQEVKSDFENKTRPQGKSTDIGAFEYNDASTTYINPDAGPDQSICINEKITLTASGGTSYKWSTGENTKQIEVSPSETTVYSVEVSVGNISAKDEVKVTVIDLTLDAGQDITIDKGDEIVLVATGGTNYVWSNGMEGSSITISPDETTVFSVTSKEGNCQFADQVKVTVESIIEDQPLVTANAGIDRTICSGESVILTANGGESYLWSNGSITKSIEVNPSKSTKYTVTASNKINSDTDEVLVNVISTIAEAGQDVSITLGESVKLNASGGVDFLWSNGAETKSIVVQPSNTSVYTVRVSNGNCFDEDEVKVIVQQPTLNPNNTSFNAGEDQTICFGESTTLTAEGSDGYIWNNGESGAQITVSPLRTETYEVSTILNGINVSDTVTITVENCVSISDDVEPIGDGDIQIQLYPNPTTGIVKIQSNSAQPETDVHLINMNGKILYQETLRSEKGNFGKQLDFSNFTKGVYFLRFLSENEQMVKKIVLI